MLLAGGCRFHRLPYHNGKDQARFSVNTMASITELEEQIRNLINAPRKHSAIFKDSTQYLKLCSCLDVIGDIELAFCAYEEMLDSPQPGSSYILAYGFLQALFVQQDAVCNLHEALKISWEPDPLLAKIRKIRNDAIGHPTKRGGGHGKCFSFISRPSITKSGFQLMTMLPNQEHPMFRQVGLKDLLDTQHNQLEKALTALLQALQKEEMEHREKFKSEKLEELFPPLLPYYFEKVYESILSNRVRGDGAIHVSQIHEIITNFNAALENRGIAGAYPGVEYQLKLLEYPLSQLAEYFAHKGEWRLNANDARIFTSFVHNEISKLREMAIEIDEEYAMESKLPPD